MWIIFFLDLSAVETHAAKPVHRFPRVCESQQVSHTSQDAHQRYRASDLYRHKNFCSTTILQSVFSESSKQTMWLDTHLISHITFNHK